MKYALVVDDDVEICRLIKFYFHLENLQCETAHTEQDILEIFKILGPPAIILLDAIIPGQDIALMLTSIRSTFEVPIILFTASNHYKEIAKLNNIDLVLRKPFDLEELEDIVNKYLRE